MAAPLYIDSAETNPYYQLVDELPYGRSGVPQSIFGERSYIRKFRVIVRVKEMNALAVSIAPGLPYIGSFYQSGGVEWDALALLTEYSCEQEHQDDWQNWIVTAHYSTQIRTGPPVNAGHGPDGSQDNPEMEYPDIHWDSDTSTENPEVDLYGKRYANSAGQAFEKPYPVPVAYRTLNISRNERSFNDDVAAAYDWSLNHEEWLRKSRGTVQLYPPVATAKWRGALGYWRVTYKFKVNRIEPLIDDETGEPLFDSSGNPVMIRREWQPRILDQGKNRWQGDESAPDKGRWVPFTTAPNKLETRLLDGEGRTSVNIETDWQKPPRFQQHWLDFQQFNYADFGALLLQGLG